MWTRALIKWCPSFNRLPPCPLASLVLKKKPPNILTVSMVGKGRDWSRFIGTEWLGVYIDTQTKGSIQTEKLTWLWPLWPDCTSSQPVSLWPQMLSTKRSQIQASLGQMSINGATAQCFELFTVYTQDYTQYNSNKKKIKNTATIYRNKSHIIQPYSLCF